uniref:Apoptosis inducing factor mitochondria associated 5 n=1 Tax=Neolamprologus brichardi TaxID=32507 RepID=A0A3Q4G4P9_NEOBR
VVCLESDLQDGQMMEVEVGHHGVLLTRSGGKYSAIGNQCTHYGAPLSKGFISGNRVRCPWHGSCFNVHTGDLEEYPGIDCLPCHKTLRQEKRIKRMGTAVPGVTHTVLLLGGGAASLICAETLRQENFGGRIIMVTREDLLPYDKTRLSKVMNVESDSILMRRMEFFHQYDIEVWLRKEALSMDTDKKTVTFDDGSVQSYDQLLISTGCRYRQPHKYVYKHILGSSINTFSSLRQASIIPQLKYYCRLMVSGSPDYLQHISLTCTFPPNLCFGTLIISSVCVSLLQYMHTNVPDVFCGGDLAMFPLAMAKNRMVNIGHWQMAQAQGRIVALNMLNKTAELNSVPFYWTVLVGKTIRYTGYGEGYTELVIKGKFEDRKFLALYIKDEEVIAAAGLNFDPAVSAVAERLATGKVITKNEAQSDDLSWLQLS